MSLALENGLPLPLFPECQSRRVTNPAPQRQHIPAARRGGSQLLVPRSHFGYSLESEVSYASSTAAGVPDTGRQSPRVRAEWGTVLLAGQDGPAFFLIPVVGDVIAEDRELRRAMAKANLRRSWRLSEASAVKLSDEEIEQEIQRVRTVRQRRKAR
jgi:hypothetical protein